MGGVLFIDEAYYLYRPENERDYGQEAIEILLQVMENQRDDLVVILAGYKDRMDTFFRSQSRDVARASRTTSTFPTTPRRSSCAIAELHAGDQMHYRLSTAGCEALREYIARAQDAAAFRQCALDPQRARPRPAAAGQPPVRRRSEVRASDLAAASWKPSTEAGTSGRVEVLTANA